MKFLLTALLLPGLAGAAILPDTIGAYQRGPLSKPALSDKPIWDEYGLKESERADYQGPTGKFTVTVYRLQDTTGSMAAFDWLRPNDATPSTASKLAAETPNSLLLTHGNYLFDFEGYKPPKADLDSLTGSLRNADMTVLPILPGYLPSDGLVTNSERYITGPSGLQKFASAIPASVAAFRYGTEAQFGIFHSQQGDFPMLIFNYPTPQIAMQRISEFQKLPGAVAKRSGPMVSVVLSPTDVNFAERLVSQVRYQAEVTQDEYVPTQRDNIGNLVINAFVLIGILLAIALLGGLFVGGFRAFRRHNRHGEEPDAVITLGL